MAKTIALRETTQPFLAYLEEWYSSLSPLALTDVVGSTPDALSHPIAELFQRAYDLGVRNMVLTQDTHDPETPEFRAYPPHCVAGTSESDAIPELKALPFFDEITIVQKNSLSSYVGTSMDDWHAAHRQIDTYVVVGDCSDLCIYTTAMHMRLVANAHNMRRRVIIPASHVNTFDTPVSAAREMGIKAHDGDLHHVLFLHHMAMNGVEVVQDLT